MAKSISICISTYKRPEGISRLLNALNKLDFNKHGAPDIELIVVDNDSLASAREVCENFRSISRWKLIYEVEVQQGVSYARNRTVELATKEADYIAFIDDDEVPDPNWLDELLIAQEEYSADVVSGPVYPLFDDKSLLPDWVEKGGFFSPLELKTGSSLNAAFTNNVLVNATLLRGLKIVFDPRFAIKGSEDTHLFMRLRKMGAQIIWTNEAIVFEHIPPSRTNLKWLLDRGFWGWSSYSLFEQEIFPSLATQLGRLIKGLGLIITGFLSIFPSLLLGRHRLYKAILNIYRGAGSLSGLLGFQGDW